MILWFHDLSLNLNVIFSTESGISIQGQGGRPLEKPRLPSKPNPGRGWDTLGMSLSFSSGQQKTLRTCWNFSQQNKHVVGGYLFLMGWMRSRSSICSLTPHHAGANPADAPFPSLGHSENLFPYFLPE